MKRPRRARQHDDSVQWDVHCGTDIITEATKINLGKRVVIDVRADGKRLQLRLSPDDAYAFKRDVELAIDQAVGS